MNKDIIFLNPVCTHNIWGGTRLNREFGYSIEGDDIGECWGISAHPSGDDTVRKRSLSGNEAVRTVGEAPRAVRKHGNGSFPSAGQDH